MCVWAGLVLSRSLPLSESLSLSLSLSLSPSLPLTLPLSLSPYSIGYAIAQRLARDGAHVMVSSRKEANVRRAVEELRAEGGVVVEGMVCHVGKEEHRTQLIKEVEEGGSSAPLIITSRNAKHCGASLSDERVTI